MNDFHYVGIIMYSVVRLIILIFHMILFNWYVFILYSHTLNSTAYDALRVAVDMIGWHNIVKTKLMDGGGHDSQT